MSFKAKNLNYEAAQPAFLQRLRGEIGGNDSGRHERPMPRNKGQKKDDDDDAPTYVLEDTNQSLTKAEYEALVAGKDAEETNEQKDESECKPKPSDNESKDPKQQSKDNIAEVGKATKKRKAVKVIGGDEGEDEVGEKTKTKPAKKPKKKAKPVKLSFGDQEEG